MKLQREILLAFAVLLLPLASAEKLGSPRPFHLVSNSEAEQVLGDGAAFNHSWLLRDHATTEPGSFPDALPPPSFVQMYSYESDCSTRNATSCMSLSELGSIASHIVDAQLGNTGAILFRNLPIQGARDFRNFFDGVDWPKVKYVPYGENRRQVEGVDLATNIPGQYALGLHNEMSYSPNPASRIAFFCSQPALIGGETILAQNKELTARLPQEILDFVRQLGGVLYTRRHYDGTGSLGPDFSQMRFSSWQDKCHSTSKEEAIQFFVDMGFDRSDMEFDQEGTLTVRFRHPGFIEHLNEQVWFNVIHSNLPTTPDGLPFPDDFMDELELHHWQVASAFKLQENDWLVLDNKRVMHGRLPYSMLGPERQLLTVYSA